MSQNTQEIRIVFNGAMPAFLAASKEHDEAARKAGLSDQGWPGLPSPFPVGPHELRIGHAAALTKLQGAVGGAFSIAAPVSAADESDPARHLEGDVASSRARSRFDWQDSGRTQTGRPAELSNRHAEVAAPDDIGHWPMSNGCLRFRRRQDPCAAVGPQSVEGRSGPFTAVQPAVASTLDETSVQ